MTTRNQPQPESIASRRDRQGRFLNESPFPMENLSILLSLTRRAATEKRIDARPTEPVPLVQITPDKLESPCDCIYRLGHSSLLLKLRGVFWLVDPVFSERISPVSGVGAKRFHPPPIELEALPEISGVIISHDHYDHLDRPTIEALADRVGSFVAPLEVGRHLRRWGVAGDRIHELDWWEWIDLYGVKLTASPAQHFSGRGPCDADQTLWASWIIETDDTSIFYGGDSGYFGGFKRIGDRFGPFDLTILENGAYDRAWPKVHMVPEETLQAHKDLKGQALMPVHNSTFDLARHPWWEPITRLRELAMEHRVALVTPEIGAGVPIDEPRGAPA